MFRQHLIYLFLLSAKLINYMDFENPLTQLLRAKDRGKLLDQMTDVNNKIVLLFIFPIHPFFHAA